MKLRNLLLAGLAIFAMSSCSNEVNDTPLQPQAKDALVQFNLSFPVSSASTRATEKGLTEEQEFTNLNFYIKYDNGTLQTEALTKSDFTQSGNSFKLNKLIEATAGNAQLYVVMSPENAGLSAAPTFAETKDAGYTASLDALASHLAKANEFVMTGSITKNIVAGQINDASIRVKRVAAKLVENTPSDAFTVTEESSSDNQALKIKIENYSFANLNPTSHIFEGSSIFTPEVYFQPFATNALFANYIPKAVNGKQDNSNITYCLENAETTPTKIIYQATALWGDATEGSTFYVYNDVAYRTFELLNEGYTAADLNHVPGLSPDAEAAAFAEYGILKYENGRCYYIKDIMTDNVSTILRNNVYKLNVVGVSKLGLPEVIPPPPGSKTCVNLEVVQEEWAVNVNDFNL